MEKQLKGGNLKEGASFAHGCRAAPANSQRKVPPSGPKAEPVKTNGVPSIGGKGIK